MSTGDVLSPITEMSAHRRRFVGLPPTADRNRVRRNLFGPVDHEENRRFLEREQERSIRRDSQLYNFDFQNDVPLAGYFDWQPVTHVHPTYALRRLPYLSRHSDDSSVSAPSTSGADESQPLAQSSDPPSTAVINTSTTGSSSSITSISSNSSSSSSSTSGGLMSPETSIVTTSAQIADGRPRSLRYDTKFSVEDSNDTAIRSKTRQSKLTDYLKPRKRTAPVSKVTSAASAASSRPTKAKVPKTTSS